MIGMKQNTLAVNTGYSQQYISKLERSKKISDEALDKIASGLGVSSNLIKDFDEEKAANIISSMADSNESPTGMSYTMPINPLDKLRTALEENKKLYEALLKSEKETITLLEKMLSQQK
jgi:transcriptional regulator with XRE-family HTH domain